MNKANIRADRHKALTILEDRLGSDKPLDIDYHIDDECRRVLGLPSRPVGDKPYLGWMVGSPPKAARVGRISQEGIELIKRWEGCRTNAYLCPAGVWTIGYGHTKTAKRGMMISHVDAENLLREDIKVYEDGVRRLVRVPLTQGQFDALTSFAFNCGIAALQRSSLLRYLNQGKYNTAKLEFAKWVYAGKKRLLGLARRRREEAMLFDKK